ncbi:MAG: DinB family protein [Acidimicrobiia bacterium]
MPDERTSPDPDLGERAMLDAWLEYHRETLAVKCAGLRDDELARRSVPPSTMSMLGLVRHMADVERNWFRRVMAGEDAPPIYWSDEDPDGDFDGVDDADVAGDFATWRAECEHARLVAAELELDDDGFEEDPEGADHVDGRRGWRISLRWVLTHMIEEYARHNGHADLLRQTIDGAVGE